MKLDLFSLPIWIGNIDATNINIDVSNVKKLWLSKTPSTYHLSFKNKLESEQEKYVLETISKLISIDIKNEFKFKNLTYFENNDVFKDIKSTESVSICIRQNRFSERKRDITPDDEKNSTIFTEDQIKYINKSIETIKSKINNPKFFLWSNDFKNLDSFFPKNNFTFVSTNKIDNDLYLMSQSKHHIVIPSSFNWWGAWLGYSKKSLVIRPSHKHFSNFNLNNRDFWPDDWTIV